VLKCALHLLFFLSGAAALGYQLIWSRMFSTGLGHEMPAVLAIIAAFMAGLALGAASIDRFIPRDIRAGTWLGALEAMITLWAIAASVFIAPLNAWIVETLGISPGPLKHWLIVFAVPAVALLPATAAMGATLPAMEKFLSALTPARATVARVYAANTFGAVAGTLLAPFVLMPGLGLMRSSWALAGINAAVSAGLLLLVQLERHRNKDAVPKRTDSHDKNAPSGSTLLSPAQVAFTLFMTGLFGIAYEAAGVRVLAQVLAGTIYTYAAVLAIFLLGTAAGAAAFHRWACAMTVPKLLPRLFHGAGMGGMIGVCSLAASGWLYGQARQLGDSVAAVLIAEMITAAAVFLVPTMFMGALFSALTQMMRDARGGIGRGLAANTLGAAIAPVFVVVLLPAVGAKWVLFAAALGYFLISRPGQPSRVWLIASFILAALAVPVRLQLVNLPPNGHVAEYREGVMAAVAVVADANGERTLRVDNRFQMGGTAAADTEYRQAHLPLLLHPKPARALFLGVGTGISFGAASLYPSLAADGVELVPAVVEVMNFFAPHNFAPAQNPALRIHTADARRYVRSVDTRYDVIVGDVFHPYRDGAAALYTREHFTAVRAVLAEDGLFCQWLPLHQVDTPTLRVIARTFLEIFPDAEAWLLRFNVDVPVIGLIGRNGNTGYGRRWMAERVRDPKLGEALTRLALNDSIRLFGHLVADGASLARYSAGAPLNADDLPRIAFMAPRVNYQRAATPYASLFRLLESSTPNVRGTLALGDEASGFAREVEDYIRARDVYLRGLALYAEGDREKAIAAYVASARLSSEFTPGYAQCLSIASVLAGTDLPRAQQILRRLIEAQPNRPVAQQLLDRLGTK
jgi:spermidine synthase